MDMWEITDFYITYYEILFLHLNSNDDHHNTTSLD